ncbi:zinc finger CCCH domain-containing protein 6-like [Synchiropus splendidus]|uniref:zinc finger CCCH domain-containing protein 6-like n=1 Tax=Synchiropus splendidus TaxID=270530 RepID=UPI00237D7ACF|nr:zinc finger CCCH domain-containing protein 6-like [Synchiropus splendidus]
MDFANLFCKLSSTEEGSRRAGPPAFTTRDSRGCKRRGGRQSFQPESSLSKKLKNDHGNGQDYEYRTSEGPKRGQTNRGRGRRDNNFKSHIGQQNHQSKTADGPRRGQKNRGRGQRGGSFSAPARPRFMTQEFKDQNALVVDGQILCKHFIWGNCIKGDDCQMVHAPVHNGLIKEMCKFYVVGFCSRGDSCPYMHKSFPCKFFHRKGLCVNGENCKFSHDPLTSVTEPLLEATMRMEQEARERLMKVEQKQHTDVESPSVEQKEENKPLDVLNPAMPKFYNSLEPHSEVDHAEEPSEDTEEDNDAPHSGGSPAKASAPVEPVCYSVEAVLGPRHSVPALFSYSASQVPPSCPAAPAPPTHPTVTNLSEAPYSVAAVLGTYKSLSSFSNPPSTSPVAKVCVPASSPAAAANTQLSPVDKPSKASCLQPPLRSQSKICDGPLTPKHDKSFTLGAKMKTVVDVSSHNYPSQNHQSSPETVRRLDRQQGLCGGFKSLFSSPPGQRAAPTKPPSSEEASPDSPSSPSQRGAQFKDCVTFLVRNLKTIETSCHQPDSQEPEAAKRKREGAGMAGRCGEFQFKSLFSAALPGASSNTPEPADGGGGGEVVAGTLCALFKTSAPMGHLPTASPNSLHLQSSRAKATQQAAGTHSGEAMETCAVKQQLSTQLDTEGRSHQQLQSNTCSQLKSLFLSLSPSSLQ